MPLYKNYTKTPVKVKRGGQTDLKFARLLTSCGILLYPDLHARIFIRSRAERAGAEIYLTSD